MSSENEGRGGRTGEMLRLFDNHDPRLPYYDLILSRDLSGIREYPLPEGYSYACYAPGGSREWIGIEMSAREFGCEEEGRKAWDRFFGGRETLLPERMFFVLNSAGYGVATATAYFDIHTGDDGENGWLHWVAVRREEQGRGLSKPLITHTLARLADLGYRRAFIHTQTTTWLACRIYLDLGFVPDPANAEKSRRGWEIVKSLTGHPALDSFGETDLSEFLRGDRKK